MAGLFFQTGRTDRLMPSLFDFSVLVPSRKSRGVALPVAGLVVFLMACGWATSGEQSSPATAGNGKAGATSGKPKYLLFWHDPEKAGELAERVGMKGDGKTRLLGFGLPNPTFEIEAQLPSRIRSAFAAAREHDMAVMLHFDFHLAWKNRPDLWNWFDPNKPGYNPNNKYNVEWHGWDGPPNKVHYLNHGVLERLPPNMCFTSKRTRAEVTRIVSKVIGPVLREEIAKLKAEGKEALFAGVLVGSEPSIDDYSKPNPELHEDDEGRRRARGTARLPGAPGSWLQRGQSAGRFPKGPREDRSGNHRFLVRAVRRCGHPRGEALSPRGRTRAHRGDERSHLDGLQQVFPARLDHLCGRGSRGELQTHL